MSFQEKLYKWAFENPEFGEDNNFEVIRFTVKPNTNNKNNRIQKYRSIGLQAQPPQNAEPPNLYKSKNNDYSEPSSYSDHSDYSDYNSEQEDKKSPLNNQSVPEQDGKSSTDSDKSSTSANAPKFDFSNMNFGKSSTDSDKSSTSTNAPKLDFSNMNIGKSSTDSDKSSTSTNALKFDFSNMNFGKSSTVGDKSLTPFKI